MKPTNGKEYLVALKRDGKMGRQGVTFSTSNNFYLYDSGTGNVAFLDEESRPIITALFDEKIDVQTFEDMLSCEETVNSIVGFLQEENLLMRPAETQFNDLTPYLSEAGLECQQLIIELTGQCNLRCKYCVYNDHYEQTRKFNEEFIDFNTAKKAIDYAYAHRSSKFFAIGFYGGEPLLNFKVMRQCIDYCLTTYKEVEPTFSFTTNLTLMTEEIADYLAQIPNMSIIVSIDGPKEIQNQNRTFANGAPTFDAVYRGLKNICNAVKKHNSNCQININCVFMPPYTQERFSQINDFFESLTFLPPNSGVSATYPASGSVPDDFTKQVMEQGYTEEDEVQWVSWAVDKVKQEGNLPNSPNLYTSLMNRILSDVHNRRLIKEPMGQHCWNACCIPGNRRLYVCTNGFYKLCEKMGESPYIGHVDTGVDFTSIKKYYIEQYEEASLPECSQCWAVNLCSLCYCLCYSKEGIDIKLKRERCNYARESALAGLRVYYEIFEKNPDIIKHVSLLERT